MRWVLVSWLLACAAAAQGTPSMQHLLQQEGGDPTPITGVDLLRAPKLQEIFLRYATCSAFGSPKGRWLVRDQQLFLIALVVCGPDLPLEAMYPQAQEGEMLATWINGPVHADRGRVLCWRGLGGYRPPIREASVEYTVQAGRILEVRTQDNQHHPDLLNTVELEAFHAKHQGRWPAKFAPLCRGY